MVIAEVGIQNIITRFSSIAPFVYSFTVNVSSLASFWTQAFGANNEVTDERSNVISVYVLSTDRFAKVISLSNCLTTQESFFYDFANQLLYVNFGVNYNPLIDSSEMLKVIGFCDTAVVYVDDIPFIPLITDAPKLTQKQDMINYDQLAFSMGSITINNQSGDANFLKEATIFSNDVALSFLDYDGRSEHTRSELTPLAWYLVENVEIGKQKGKISLQDVRKTLNGKLPNVLFDATTYPDIEDDLVDNPIPLAFGSVLAKATCTNGKIKTGVGNYRVALEMVSINQVQVFNSVTDKWYIATPVSINAPSGEFVLSEFDARGINNKGSWNPITNVPTLSNATGIEGDYYLCTATATRDLGAGNVDFVSGEYAQFSEGRWSNQESVDTDSRECKVAGYGSDASKPSKVISRLEYLSNGIEYNSSFYNITEIGTEESTLGAVSVFISEQQELNEIIRKLQEGSTNRFRYEINADGLRTIRLDNLSRTSSAYVSREKIKENNELNIYTDKDTIAASIKVTYGPDYTADKPYVIDSSKESSIAKSVRERPQIEFETFLVTRESAIARAALESDRLGVVRRFVDCTLMGKEFLTLRIYDIITVELTDVKGQWMGVWKCQVLGIAPDTTLYENAVTLVLVERVVDVDEDRVLKIGHDGNIKYEKTDVIKVGV